MVYRRKTTRRNYAPKRRVGRKPLGAGSMINAYNAGQFLTYKQKKPQIGMGMTSARNSQRAFAGQRLRFKNPIVARTQVRRNTTVPDNAGYIQWQKSNYTRTLGKLTQNKLNMAFNTLIDLTWRRTGRLDLGGSIFAGNYVDTTVSPNLSWRPMYLIDLTSGNTPIGNGTPVFQLTRTNSTTPFYSMMPVAGHDSLGGLTNNWQRINTPFLSTGVTASLSDISILRWSEMRFDLWGSKQHPVEWTMTLCQLDERLLPVDNTFVIDDRTAVDWYDGLASQLVFSPSERKNPLALRSNLLKVLDRRSFIINPTSTTESDADPHVRTVKLFYNMNRKVSFCWRSSVTNTPVLNVDPAQAVGYDVYTAGDQQTTAEPKARVFMFLTCKNWRAPPTSYVGMTTDNTGSFNLTLTNRWVA